MKLKRFFPLTILFVLALTGCSSVGWGLYSTTLGSVPSEGWLSDLSELRSGLDSGHPNLFHAGRQADYDALATTLRSTAETTRDGERRADLMVAGIARLLATIGEGHTSINSSPTSYYPFAVSWFAVSGDQTARELRVVRVQDVYRDYLGDTVVAVGGVPVSELAALIDPYISVDRATGYPRAERNLLTNPRLMRGIGLANESGVTYELRDASGSLRTLTVGEVDASALQLVDIWSGGDKQRALSFQHSDESRWYEIVGNTMYLQYNRCDLAAYTFFQGVVKRLREGDIDRLVIDLRQNGGGISLPGSWFARELSGIASVNRVGGIYVLIGPGTFSSAEMMAADLMDDTKALFAGEPLAESVDSWGEVKRFTLSNSGLVIGYSTRFFNYSKNKDLRTVDGIIQPDPGLARLPTYEEWAAGRDPVYELAMSGAGQ